MDVQTILSVQISAGFSGQFGTLRDLTLEVRNREVLGLVGQSGCGKSTLALAILRLLHLKGGALKGTIIFKNQDLMKMTDKQMRSLRGREIALVLQSPIASLNPSLCVGTQLKEAWRVHRPRSSRAECEQAIEQTLENVRLPSGPEILRRFPSELSVGQAQRVLIGMAVMHRPTILIADEPTSALDIFTQSEILKLFASLSRKLEMGILYISHDLMSVATISDRVAVMDEGRIVECSLTRELFRHPAHPSTKRMLAALPAVPCFEDASTPCDLVERD